ncbi:MAG: COX15/CtaA family protein [Bryobacteraceae bacterium]
MPGRWLHRYAVLTAAAAFVLVVAGGLVTSNEAGLAVPDWPLSFGQLMPPMQGGVVYEHGHRMIAATVGLLTIILAVWLWRSPSARWLKRLGAAALAAVIVQGLLGGLTVLMRLPAAVSISHACLAQLFFSAIVVIARGSSADWQREPELVEDAGSPPLKVMVWMLPPAIVIQLLLGAGYRHKALGIVPHIVGALVLGTLVFAAGISVIGASPKHRPLGSAARRLLWLTGIQIVLGIAAYLSRILWEGDPGPHPGMVALTVSHVAAGALVMASAFLLAAEAQRCVRRVMPPEESARGLQAGG